MAVARISRDDWRSAAGRLALFAMLVFGLTAHAVGLSISLHRFESGTQVRPGTYVARFTEIAAPEGRPYRDFPVEYPPVSLGAIDPEAVITPGIFVKRIVHVPNPIMAGVGAAA